MVGRVDGVGCEDEVEVGTTTMMGVVCGEVGFRVRPIEGGGRDGAAGCEGRVLAHVVLQVREDGGEVGEVGVGCEEGGGG